MADSYITPPLKAAEILGLFAGADRETQAQARAAAERYIDAHYTFTGGPAMSHSADDIEQVGTEVDLMDRILDALEFSGVITKGVGGEGYAVETITAMCINLTTRDGQSFTLGIDTL